MNGIVQPGAALLNGIVQPGAALWNGGASVYKTEGAMIKSETRRRALGPYDEALRKYRSGDNSKR